MGGQKGMMEKIPVVYILGSGHCGSTLLNLLLNAHPRMVGLSELVSFQNYLQSGQDEVLTDQALWVRIRDRFEQITPQGHFSGIDLSTPSLKQILNNQLPPRWVSDNYYLLRAVLDVMEEDVAVDASKGVRRLLGLEKTGMYDFRVIHLVRNGRAVVHSYRKKGYSFLSSFRRWFIPAVFTRRLMSPELLDATLTVKYEDLCDNPERVLEAICRHIRLPYTGDMLAYRSVPYIGVGGNRMGKKGDVTEIRKDEAWKGEGISLDAVLFSLLLGGWVNGRYGYKNTG